MTIDEAIEILESYNKWRRGAEIEIQKPVLIGMAIDLVIFELKYLRKDNTNTSSASFDQNVTSNNCPKCLKINCLCKF